MPKERNKSSQSEEQVEKNSIKKAKRRKKRLLEQLEKARQAHTRAEERVRQAENRVRKWHERILHVEERLKHIEQIIHPGSRDEEEVSLGVQVKISSFDDNALQRARAARAAVQLAEREVRAATERVLETEMVLEQADFPRHLMGELEHLRTVASQAGQRVRDAELLAEESMQSLSQEQRLILLAESALVEDDEDGMLNDVNDAYDEYGEYEDYAITADIHKDVQLLVDDSDEALSEVILAMEKKQEDIEERKDSETVKGSPEYTVREIEEEEDTVESLAAMIIADAAAIAAAEADARAEVSSVRTREARIEVQEADEALQQLRIAIQQGTFMGDDVEAVCQKAEQRVIQARARLTDAEAAEKQALRVAQDAEADAMATEGMAQSAAQHLMDEEQPQQSPLSSTEREQERHGQAE